jgi:hypothetical protein
MMHTLNKDLKQIYGLDFGTSNTHLSLSTSGDSNPIVDDVKINSNSSIPSVILYDERTFEIIGFGQPAIEEWYSMNKSEKKRFTLGSGFKQRLAFNKRAQTETEMFLTVLFNTLYRQKLISDISDAKHYALTCGIPSKTVKDHVSLMSSILEKSTGSHPVLIEEPLGALFYHLNRKDITKEDASKGVLVVDFGGGTLDFAYLKNFRIQKVWGSPVIGGVLFDDLFYNLFLEQNKGIRKEIEDEGLDGYLRTVYFKNLKEKYSSLLSASMKNAFSENVTFATSSFGSFFIESDDFIFNRMKEYVPSNEMIRDMAGLSDFSGLIKEGKINLIETLKNEIQRSGKEFNITKDSVSLIILTGGSSRWQFFMDMISDEFPYTRIVSSADPEATISRGLGLCYSARQYEEKVRNELRETKSELITKLQTAYKKIFNSSLNNYFDRLFDIYKPAVSKTITDFFENSGTLNEFEISLKEAVKEQKVIVENTTSGFMSEVNFLIENKTKNELSKWFNKSMIKFEFAQKGLLTGADRISSENDLEAISETLFLRLSTLSSLIVSIVTSSLFGSTILIPGFFGPIAWLTVFIGSITILFASMAGFKKKMTKGIKNMRIPKWLLKTLMINEKAIIRRSDKSLRTSLNQNREELTKKANNILDSNKKKLERLIEEQIEKISYSNIIDFL